EGREDPEVIAARRRHDSRRHDRRAAVAAKGDALLFASAAKPLLASPRVSTPVGAYVQLLGTALSCERDRLGDRVAPPEEEPSAGAPQRVVEVAQRLDQEGHAVGG